MHIQLESIGPHHGHLIISIEPQDYAPKVEEKLKDLRKSARLKGFRQGAAPESMIRKLYADEIKMDLVQKTLNQAITDYQKSEGIDFLGDLLEIPDHSLTSDQSNFQFKFEVGLVPKVNPDTYLPEINLTRYKIGVTDQHIDEEIKHFLDRFSDQVAIQEPAKEGDILTIDAVELEGDQAKENGWKTNFTVILDELMGDGIRQELTGKEIGYHFHFNIREVEKNTDEASVRKYLLKIPQDQMEQLVVGDIFEGTLVEIKRKVPAELNEALYLKAFGPDSEIREENQLREHFRKMYEKHFDEESNNLLDLELVRAMVKTADLQYPDEFMAKWLKRTYNEWEKLSGHELEHELYHFKENMGWRLIREKIIKDKAIAIEYQDLVDAVLAELSKSFPVDQLSPEVQANFVRRMIDSEEKAMKYLADVQTRKALDWIKNQLTFAAEDVTMETFKEKVKHLHSHNH